MAEKRRVRWGDLGDLFDGPHATPTRVTEGPYFLNISSLKSGRLDLSESDHVSYADFTKWTKRVTPRDDDLLFSYETRLGEAALMPPGVEACLGRRMALLRPDPELVNPRFLLYLFLSPSFQRIIATHTIHGATVPRIGLATMPDWEVEIPPLEDQHAIAEVLGALDDKIAANERTIGLTDALVRSEYLDLRGETVPLSELAVNIRQPARQELLDSGIEYLGLEHLPRRRMWTAEFGNSRNVKSPKSRFEPGDVLFGKLRPYFHKVISTAKSGACSTDILVVRARSESIRGLVLAACASDEVVQACTGSSQGTRMPRTNWADLSTCLVRWPGKFEASNFSAKVASLDKLASGLGTENLALVRTRDQLLPLLMSGKVTVEDIERDIEDIV